MKFSYRIKQSVFDKKGFKAQLYKNSLEIRKEAAREFVLAAFNSLPIWSGAARGTFLPLTRVLQLAGLRGQIRPLQTSRKDSEHGIDAGKAKGSGKFSRGSKYKHTFTFTHELYHYWLNENNAMPYGPDKKATPWNTFEDGSKAWLAYVDKRGMQVMPDWRDYLVQASIKF